MDNGGPWHHAGFLNIVVCAPVVFIEWGSMTNEGLTQENDCLYTVTGYASQLHRYFTVARSKLSLHFSQRFLQSSKQCTPIYIRTSQSWNARQWAETEGPDGIDTERSPPNRNGLCAAATENSFSKLHIFLCILAAS